MRRRSIAFSCGVLLLIAGGNLLAGCNEPPPARPDATASDAASGSPTGTPSTSPTLTPSPAPPASSPTTRLVTFTQLRAAEPGNGAAEVTAQAQGDRFLTGMGVDDEVRAAVTRARQPGTRLFAFTFSGCQFTGASLIIQGARVYATPTGGGNVQCLVAEYFLAVYAVPADRVPPNAKLG
jgi:hypothetical protein